MRKIKQLFCRHRYADKNLDIVEINHCPTCEEYCEVTIAEKGGAE